MQSIKGDSVFNRYNNINNNIMEDQLIHISFSKIDFNCPYCAKPYKDDEDKYLNRCNKNKSGYTTIKCECEMTFGFTYDITGEAVAFKLTNNLKTKI